MQINDTRMHPNGIITRNQPRNPEMHEATSARGEEHMLFGLLKADRSWIVTPVARHRFAISAIVSLFWSAIFLALQAFPRLAGIVGRSALLKAGLLLLIFLPGLISSLVIFFGMVWYCWRVDKSNALTRVLWAVLFLLTAWFGAILYFVSIYRVQTGGVKTGPSLPG